MRLFLVVVFIGALSTLSCGGGWSPSGPETGTGRIIDVEIPSPIGSAVSASSGISVKVTFEKNPAAISDFKIYTCVSTLADRIAGMCVTRSSAVAALVSPFTATLPATAGATYTYSHTFMLLDSAPIPAMGALPTAYWDKKTIPITITVAN